jgi:hypothetical protein
MDVVNFFQKITDKYNAESKCGFCFQFHAPLTDSSLNQSLNTDLNKCCVQIHLTDLAWEENSKEKSSGGSYADSCEYYFNLWVLIPTELGVNNYNEIPDHLITDSNWEKIYKPLQECFGCGNVLPFCQLNFQNVIIKKWRASQVIKFGDQNLSGWKIQGQFKINL